MIRKRKWIEIHSPQEPAAGVAARALDARLRLVLHELRLAAGAGVADPEHVHQTRVASRRARTALSIFESFLPRQEFKWFRKKLRLVRKAAGAARDYDVLTERLKASVHAEQPAGQVLLKWVHDQRRLAQRPIIDIAVHLKKKHFKRRAKRLVKDLSKRGQRRDNIRFGSLALVRMNRLIAEFFAIPPSDLQELPALHEFRVRGKHLRYTMEILAGAFSPKFRDELYAEFVLLQEELGRINDHASAAAHYQQWLGRADNDAVRDLLGQLIEEETAETLRLHEKFVAEWTAARAMNLKQQFVQQIQSACGALPRKGTCA